MENQDLNLKPQKLFIQSIQHQYESINNQSIEQFVLISKIKADRKPINLQQNHQNLRKKKRANSNLLESECSTFPKIKQDTFYKKNFPLKRTMQLNHNTRIFSQCCNNINCQEENNHLIDYVQMFESNIRKEQKYMNMYQIEENIKTINMLQKDLQNQQKRKTYSKSLYSQSESFSFEFPSLSDSFKQSFERNTKIFKIKDYQKNLLFPNQQRYLMPINQTLNH